MRLSDEGVTDKAVASSSIGQSGSTDDEGTSWDGLRVRGLLKFPCEGKAMSANHSSVDCSLGDISSLENGQSTSVAFLKTSRPCGGRFTSPLSLETCPSLLHLSSKVLDSPSLVKLAIARMARGRR